MKTKLLGALFFCLVGGPTIAAADTIYDWSWTSANLSVSGTIDVSAGQAVSGGGTITASNVTSDPTAYAVGTPLTLLTATTPGVASVSGTTFTGQFSGGDNLTGDTTVNAADPFLSGNGLVFSVGSYANGKGEGFNPWANGAGNYQAAFGYQASNVESGTFTLTVAPVPLPATLPLLLSGVVGLGAMVRRRKTVLA